jgi:hypothetical protein
MPSKRLPYDIIDLPSRRRPPTPGFRLNRTSRYVLVDLGKAWAGLGAGELLKMTADRTDDRVRRLEDQAFPPKE